MVTQKRFVKCGLHFLEWMLIWGSVWFVFQLPNGIKSWSNLRDWVANGPVIFAVVLVWALNCGSPRNLPNFLKRQMQIDFFKGAKSHLNNCSKT